MKQNAFCPISDKQVNEQVTRLNALLTVLIIITFSIIPNLFLALFLVTDFIIRASNYSKYSPIAVFSTNVVKLFSVSPQLINAGPKIFAARIASFLSALLLVSFALNLNVLSYSLSGILGLFAFLEFAFGWCVACKIYPYVYKMFYKDNFNSNFIKHHPISFN